MSSKELYNFLAVSPVWGFHLQGLVSARGWVFLESLSKTVQLFFGHGEVGGGGRREGGSTSAITKSNYNFFSTRLEPFSDLG